MFVQNVVYRLLGHLRDDPVEVFSSQDLFTLRIDDFPLLVHDVIVLKKLFPYFEVVLFHLLLCVFYGL